MLTSVLAHFRLFHLKTNQPPPHVLVEGCWDCTRGGGKHQGSRWRERAWWQLRHVLPSTGFDTSILPICKDSLGWMFNKLDMNYDLLLDHSEINAIYLDKYEPCIKPLFNSCDSFKDGKLSNNEWCYCFQKPGGKAGGRWGPEGRAAMLCREGPPITYCGDRQGSASRKTQLGNKANALFSSLTSTFSMVGKTQEHN